MKLVGKLLMLAALSLLAIKAKIIFGFIILFFVGINLAHGEREWPDVYYRKSKGVVGWRKKLNPWWWLLNDDDPVAPLPEGYVPTMHGGPPRPPELGPRIKNDWFHPAWPQWLRLLGWGFRNPTCNLDRYVLGFWDKQDWWAQGMWPSGSGNWMIFLPWFAFTYLTKEGKEWQFYTGWKPNGEFGWVSLRRKG